MKRIASLDLARGFTVLMIAPIHAVMIYSETGIRDTLLGNLLAFIAEWHGAQVFMLVMGMSYALSGDQSVESAFKKAAHLMVFAYLLNLLKFVIPHFFGGLPPALLELLQVEPGIHGYIRLFAIGDILHFAAISLIVLAWVSGFRQYDKVACWLSIIICFISPFFWGAGCDNGAIHYGLELIGGHPPHVFFPLFPWLVYPLLGLCLGKMIQQKEGWLGLDSVWIPGFGLTALALLLKYFLHDTGFSSFYRTSPLDTIIHVGFVLIMLSVWHSVSHIVKPNYLFKLFHYASRRITQIYIIQWILICWLIPFVGYRQAGFFVTLFLIFLTSLTTLALSLLTDLARSRK